MNLEYMTNQAMGNQDLAIKSMKEAVLYEAPWSDETMQAYKQLLCELMNGHNRFNKPMAARSENFKNMSISSERTDVFYGRTDGTIGYKEYSAVVVKTAETDQFRYLDDLYDPHPQCKYTVLFTVPPREMPILCKKVGVKEPDTVGWVKSPLKEVILDYWKEMYPDSEETDEIIHGISLFAVGY